MLTRYKNELIEKIYTGVAIAIAFVPMMIAAFYNYNVVEKAKYLFFIASLLWFFFVVAIYTFVDNKYNIFSRYENNSVTNKKLLSVSIILLLCSVMFAISGIVFLLSANTNIGSIFEKNAYEEQYYIYLRRNNKEAKSYKLCADIVKSDYGYPSSTDDGNFTTVTQGNGYFLKKVYWNNGGYLTFLQSHEDLFWGSDGDTEIIPNKETVCYDLNEEKYYITLTTEKVKLCPR